MTNATSTQVQRSFTAIKHRVLRGEVIEVTENGEPIMELHPVGGRDNHAQDSVNTTGQTTRAPRSNTASDGDPVRRVTKRHKPG